MKMFLIIFILYLSFISYPQNYKVIKVNGAEAVEGELIIKFKNPSGLMKISQINTARQSLFAKYEMNSIRKFKISAEHIHFKKGNIEDIIKELKDSKYIEYAEPNYIRKIETIPNDFYFNKQWSLKNSGQNGGTINSDINATDAWDITIGDTNIVVGVFDTGIDYLHEDLSGNIWKNHNEIPNNGIDDDVNGYTDDYNGWNFIANNNDPLDDNGHGTHMAGIIGAVGNNSKGISGIAWKVKLMPLKIIDSNGNMNVASFIIALEYAILNNVKIINASYGGYNFSQAEYDAIETANSAGILFVASSGNNSENTDATEHYPADYDLENIISVGSTDNRDHLSSFSNYGINSVDILAPGTEIYSTLPNDIYNFKSGTSPAAAHITGAAVLVASVWRNYSALEIKNRILGTVDTKIEYTNKCLSGGRLNLMKAVSNDFDINLKYSNNNFNFGGQIILTQSLPKKLYISNINDNSILIDSISVPNQFLIKRNNFSGSQINDITINPNSKDSVEIFFIPTKSGLFKGYINVYFKDHSLNTHLAFINIKGVAFNKGTVINTPYISGNWSQNNSPYIINSNVQIEENKILNINPGVDVIFTGKYKVEVGETSGINAIGTNSKMINFYPADSTEGWQGIRFFYSNVENIFDYCSFRYAKKEGGTAFGVVYGTENELGSAIYFILNNNFRILNSLFEHNTVLVGGNGGAVAGGGAGNLLIKGCTFYDNNGGAIAFRGSSYETGINNNKFLANDGVPVDVQSGANVTITNNIFANNVLNYSCASGGISIWRNSVIYSINNTFVNNKVSAITVRNGGEIYIKNSILYNNDKSIITDNDSKAEATYSDIQGGFAGIGNIDVNPKFYFLPYSKTIINYNPNIDLHLLSNSPCKNKGDSNSIYNDLDYSRNDMGAFGGNGIYPSTLNLNFGPNATNILPNQKKNITKHITLWNFRDNELSVNNIMIDSSNFEIVNSQTQFTINSNSSYPILVKDTSTDLGLHTGKLIMSLQDSIVDTIIINLISESVTGTVLQGNISGILKLSDSPFIVNQNVSASDLTIEPGVTIKFANQTEFAAIRNFKAIGKPDAMITFTSLNNSWTGLIVYEGIMEYCEIKNANTALTLNRDRPVKISNSIFHDGTSFGIVISGTDKTTFTNNLIYGYNVAVSCVQNANPSFINNTIVGNWAGIQITTGSKINMVNSIVWANSFPIQLWSDQFSDISYSIVNMDIPSSNDSGNNLNMDPKFVNKDKNDFRLKLTSPAINSGNNKKIDSLNYRDLDGNIRIWDSIVDRGAYENNSPKFLENISLISPENNSSNISLAPTLIWSSVTGADKYRLEVNSNSEFSGTVIHNGDIFIDTSKQIDGLTENTKYFWRVTPFDVSGHSFNINNIFNFTTGTTTGLDSSTNIIPTKYEVFQNYPNPFNPSTTIRYAIPKQSFVTLKIYNVLGEEIKTLVNKELNVGVYEVNFNANNLASGIYFYSLKAGNFISAKKLILMK